MNTLVSRRQLLATGAIGAVATAAAAAHAAEEQNMSQVSVTLRTIPVEHVRIASSRPFAEVRRKLEDSVPKLDPSPEALARGDQKHARRITTRTGRSCRSSLRASMALCCRLPAAGETPCNMKSAIPSPPRK
jgi:hypothetical protein